MERDTSTILEITDGARKSAYTREILKLLPDWFGNPQAFENYVRDVQKFPYFAAFVGEHCVGFFSVRVHYGHTGELYLCGVHPAYRNRGIGHALCTASEQYFLSCGCDCMVVKTLSDLVDYAPYRETRMFYKSVGFTELLTLTEMTEHARNMVRAVSVPVIADADNGYGGVQHHEQQRLVARAQEV